MSHKNTYLFTSESVTEGHPDKVCDAIADAVLDELLKEDPQSRVACEVCATTGMILVMGEISTQAYCDIPDLARRTISEIGYDRNSLGFNAETCAVLTSIKEQSPDIALGVDRAFESKEGLEPDTLGAGDQGMMFGFACKDTPEYMPLPITLAHRICRGLAEARKLHLAKTFSPDGKAQVTVRYEDGKPVHIDTVVVSTQHHESASLEEVKREVHELVLNKVLPQDMVDADTHFHINPTGRFVIGGPNGDSGLTGRKIIVDTYGGYAHHGGGSFSGKDPTKVDRSATYAARHVAKNIVAAGLAERCEVEIAYAIGVAEPVSITFNGYGSSVLPEEKTVELIRSCFDLRPEGIIRKFHLRRPIYRPLASYGHFGRPELDLPWEKLDVVDDLRKKAGLA